MNYYRLPTKLADSRHANAVGTLKPGDIVDCWLDCYTDEAEPRHIYQVIVAVPDTPMKPFRVKSLFNSSTYDLRLSYKWRRVGHIEGFDPAK